MYNVYGIPQTRTFRVLWALEEIGLDYDLHHHAPQSPRIAALNPSGKVPVLEHDGHVIWDSTAILTYLADSNGQLTYSAGSPERARQDALTFQLLDELDAVLWTAGRHSFILPEEQRCPEVKPSLKWEFARNLDRLAGALDGPFLMGEKLTIPDIICVHCLNWASSARFPVDNGALQEYSKRLRSRAAYGRVAAHIKQD
ncbi:MAG: glutathione S-transferase family protein [Pseudomonadota bacterium]